ncbi:MAG TPA: cytochrome c [Methylomirabilota bacterium]|nr:cytochrome c [Methylomirabilota bacterium]
MKTIFVLALAVSLGAVPAWAQEGTALTAQGKRLFVEQGCYGCHTLGKAGTPIALDLSRIGTKYSESDLTKWLRDPSAQKPSAHMPKIQLTEPEVRALATYLASLRG